MTLPVSGPISFNAINVELGSAGTATASLGQASYRALAVVPSGAISLSDFYGKTYQFFFTITSDQTNANLATLATAAGWDSAAQLIATIGSGVVISSNSTSTPALTVSGAFVNGVQLINNGYIIGMAGAGGRGLNSNTTGGTAGSAGGTALSVSSAISINNAGTIGGGGGGGGGGGSYSPDLGGGGGGGGQTGRTSSGAGGAGTTTGSSLSRGSSAGSTGSFSGAGAGGLGAAYPDPKNHAGTGGTGGSWGTAGATGDPGVNEFGTVQQTGTAGGAAGAAVTGNSNITWIATGTRYGSIS